MILLIAAVDALVVTAVLVVEIVLAAAGTTGATGRMMGRWDLRWDHRRKRRRGRYPAVRRQRWDSRIAQEAVRLVHVLPVHHISLEIVHRIHDNGIQFCNNHSALTIRGFTVLITIIFSLSLLLLIGSED